MDTAKELAILTLAAAASFATALLLNWFMLTALFHLLPRPGRVRSLPTPPGEALLQGKAFSADVIFLIILLEHLGN